MFCKFYGKKIPEDSKYCQYCGKSLDAIDPQAAEKVVNIPNNIEAAVKK